ncbi:MAG TPA: hypothetical protein VK574_04765 [Terracidiphilus sp.]|nr:hypothetical protein [Terracidiphilus sp.]
MNLLKSITLASALGGAVAAFAADQPTVRIEAPNLQGPRQLQQQTAKAVIQDYLDSWAVLGKAFSQNRPGLLDQGFIGDAQDKLAGTIKQQQSAGVHTIYRDKSHDVKILFYSPDGLSIELSDAVQYDVQLYDHDKATGTEQVRARYIVVLTPTEVRWRVRIFQAQPE